MFKRILWLGSMLVGERSNLLGESNMSLAKASAARVDLAHIFQGVSRMWPPFEHDVCESTSDLPCLAIALQPD